MNMQKKLLDWYDRHQRVLPWRARKGRRPDPYHVWLSEIMLQQTTVVTVGPYFHKFLSLWPTVRDLARAKPDDVMAAWAGLGYYARARNLLKCAQAVVENHGGIFPRDEQQLLGLPGIGPYTAAAVASIAFDVPAVAVDGNVERVVSRVAAITEPLPDSKPAIRAHAAKLAARVSRPGDFTQAFMELGATVCTPRKPACGICPWHDDCAARKKGIAAGLPAKKPKAAKPVRYGRVFWITDGRGRFAIHKRAGKGLYEDMYQLPTGAWTTARPKGKPQLPLKIRTGTVSRMPDAEVRHSFTHFDLILEVWCGRLSGRKTGVDGVIWVDTGNMDKYAMPTLMKKAVSLCAGGAGGVRSKT